MTCAHAVSVAVKKIDGVESVEVTLNRGHAEIKLKPGNRVRIEQIWEAVRKQGLTPKEARVVVRGRLDGSKLTVDSAIYEVSGRTGAGEEVELTGLMSPPKKKEKPELLIAR